MSYKITQAIMIVIMMMMMMMQHKYDDEYGHIFIRKEYIDKIKIES
jgi:hypothetical protein